MPGLPRIELLLMMLKSKEKLPRTRSLLLLRLKRNKSQRKSLPQPRLPSPPLPPSNLKSLLQLPQSQLTSPNLRKYDYDYRFFQ